MDARQLSIAQAIDALRDKKVSADDAVKSLLGKKDAEGEETPDEVDDDDDDVDAGGVNDVDEAALREIAAGLRGITGSGHGVLPEAFPSRMALKNALTRIAKKVAAAVIQAAREVARGPTTFTVKHSGHNIKITSDFSQKDSSRVVFDVSPVTKKKDK